MIVNNTEIKNINVEALFNSLTEDEFVVIEAAHLATYPNTIDRENATVSEILEVVKSMITKTPELIEKLNDFNS